MDTSLLTKLTAMCSADRIRKKALNVQEKNHRSRNETGLVQLNEKRGKKDTCRKL